MNALFQLLIQKDPSIKNQKFSEFIEDPLGEKAREREYQLSLRKPCDEYTNKLKFYNE